MAQSHTSYSTTREEVTSKWSDVIKNSVQIATELKQTYLLSTAKIALNKDGTARRYTFGRKDLKKNRTIMMVGETGTGKSALINMMLNYMLGVKWEDNIRFQIIPDESKRPQTESQATVITAYEIFGLEELSVPFSLTVIDMPGYGDTRGLDKDKNIAQNLYTFLESLSDVQQIDAVCLVVKASQCRLSPRQKYIFDAILSVFGKNMEKNFMILNTFSDWMPPLALQLVSESGAPFLKDENNDPVHFLFNNLPPQKFAKKYEETYKTAWDKGAESFREFFQTLDKMEPQSLKMTENVLLKRLNLETCIQSLESQIKVEKEKHRALEELKKSLEEHKEDMKKSNIYQNTCAAEKHATSSTVSEANRHTPWYSRIFQGFKDLIGKSIGKTSRSEGHQEKEDEPQYEERIRAYEDQKKHAECKLATDISRLEEELKDMKAEKAKLTESCYRFVLQLRKLALKFESEARRHSAWGSWIYSIRGFLKNLGYIMWHGICRLCVTMYRTLRGNQYEADPETCSSEGHQKEDEERIITYEDQKKHAECKLATDISRLEKELKDIEAEKTKMKERCYRSVLQLRELALKFDSDSTHQSILRLIEMLRENEDTKMVEQLQMMLKKCEEINTHGEHACLVKPL